MIQAIKWCLLLSLGLLLSPSVAAEWHKRQFSVMGTEALVELWSTDGAKAEGLIDQVAAEMERINQTMSPWIETSELAQLNSFAFERPVKVSQEMFDLLQLSLDYSEKTNGAFDITYASVGYLYDYREKQAPTDAEIDATQPLIDYRAIQLNADQRTVRFAHQGTKIDLGGIAKGHAVDLGIELLRAAGITSAFVKSGGDSRILGDRRGRLWTVGIQHPRQPDAVLTQVPVENVAFSTSGDYERFFIRDGERIHHIIDPNSGKSANESISVSILAERAVDSDALSTSVFVLGPQKGLELINRLPGVSAIIIDAQGRFVYSNDFQSQ